MHMLEIICIRIIWKSGKRQTDHENMNNGEGCLFSAVSYLEEIALKNQCNNKNTVRRKYEI